MDFNVASKNIEGKTKMFIEYASESENVAHFKIAKADNVVTPYVSSYGKKWLLIRHLQFSTNKEIKVGFLAQSPVGQRCKVKFSYIKYEAKKIKDPYAGN